MLQIDDEAVEALRQIGDLLIRGVESEGEIELEIEEATEPMMGDETVERDGVKVYLDPVAANALEDQVLGIHAHDDHFHFSFDEQTQDWPFRPWPQGARLVSDTGTKRARKCHDFVTPATGLFRFARA